MNWGGEPCVLEKISPIKSVFFGAITLTKSGNNDTMAMKVNKNGYHDISLKFDSILVKVERYHGGFFLC